MRKMMIATMLATLALGATAQAQGPVNARQLNQERRIDAGQRSGKLSPREARALDAEQRSIRRLEDQLRARHGRLTAADKRLIHRRQEAANRHILQQKHDAQRGRNKLKI